MTDALDAALEAVRREDFDRSMAQDEAELRTDAEAWARYAAERDEWLDADLAASS